MKKFERLVHMKFVKQLVKMNKGRFPERSHEVYKSFDGAIAPLCDCELRGESSRNLGEKLYRNLRKVR